MNFMVSVDLMQLTFRPYTLADSACCLALFDGNVPEFFAASERMEYAAFLALPSCPYLVGETPDRTVRACGGYFVEPDAPAVGGLAWGIVDRDSQGRGLGQQLLVVRMAALRAILGIEKIIIRTSQHTEGFYSRAGFLTVRSVPDGHAPGIDLVEMRYSI